MWGLLIFWKQRRIIIVEGILIGVISGTLISYITDVNFQASINGPISSFFKKVYSSKSWTNIRVVRMEKAMLKVDATNIVSGDTVTIENTLNNLPADLRWDIETKEKLNQLNKKVSNLRP